MIHLFLEPRPSGERVQIEWDLSNYATKADLKNENVLVHQNVPERLI